VQVAAQTLSDQVEALCEWVGGFAVADQHDLRGLRAALDDDLQVACEAEMRVVRVARDVGVDERAADDARDAVDQRVLDDAVGDVYDVVGVELEQADLRGAQASANCEASAVAEGRQLA
jgi:hypothetical protein